MEPPANACQKRLSVLEPLRSHRGFGRILARPPQSICLAQTTGSFGLPEGCDPAFYRYCSSFFVLETAHNRADQAGCTGDKSPPGRLRMPRGTTFTTNHRRDGRSLVAVAFSPSRVVEAHSPTGAKNPKAPRASADPGSIQDCFAGCEAQHQQTAFAKRKRQDAVFRVKTVPRLPPGAFMEFR